MKSVAKLNAQTVVYSSVVNIVNEISMWTVCRISGVKNVDVDLRQTVWIVQLRVLEMWNSASIVVKRFALEDGQRDWFQHNL